MGAKATDFTGRLIRNCDVLGIDEQSGGTGHHVKWHCKCRKCGALLRVRSNSLSRGMTGHICESEKGEPNLDLVSDTNFIPPVRRKRRPMTHEELGKHEAYLYLAARGLR